MTPTTITEILDKHADKYPTDLFPEDGTSQDCASARFARKLIESIRADIAKLKVWTLKPLEWDENALEARSALGKYSIDYPGYGGLGIRLNGISLDIRRVTSVDQAKSAAQEHFNCKMQEGLCPAM